MAATKEQMNVQISADLKELARTCAAAQEKSLNRWIENAIEEQIARDRKSLDVDALHKDLKKIATKYLPGKTATRTQMLAMARRVAAEDTSEGFKVERFPKPKVAARKKSAATRTRNR
ncbi:MAG TPA: hypothetical protein VHB46_00935 [Burkholderiales bacterium]|nr:hypothetical protein [Burkholderiales bacterium]